jgi:hypothetical protein
MVFMNKSKSVLLKYFMVGEYLFFSAATNLIPIARLHLLIAIQTAKTKLIIKNGMRS